MQKKKVIGVGIGVVVVIVGILSGATLHKNNETLATMAETTPPAVEKDSTILIAEEEKTEMTEPQSENTNAEETSKNEADTEQETDILQEDEGEQDMEVVPEDAAMEEIDAYMYTTADLNMRKEATTESEVINSIPYGTEIHVTARTADNWYRTERGEIGYVSGKYLSEEEPVKQTAQATSETTVTDNVGDSDTSRSYGPNKNLTKEEWEQLREAYRATLGFYPEDMPPYDPSQVTPAPMEGHLLDGGHHLIH